MLTLTPDQMNLPDDQKRAAKDALGQKALDFALAFQPDPSAAPGTPAPAVDFYTEAKKHGLTPMTTDFFAQDQPPANLPPSPTFNNAAFALTKDNMISKVVELDNGVAVLHLAEIQPGELRPLDEVKADIQKHFVEAQSQMAAKISSGLVAKSFQAAIAGGSDFKTLAAARKLKVETLPALVPYSAMQESDPVAQTMAYKSMAMQVNQVSEPFQLPGSDGYVVAHLDSRAQPDPAGLADFEKRYRNEADQQLRTLVTADWVNWKSKQPGTHKPPDLDAYGTVE